MRESSAAPVNLLVPTNNGIGPDEFPHDNSESASDSVLAESKNGLTGTRLCQRTRGLAEWMLESHMTEREREREPRGRERVVYQREREREWCSRGRENFVFLGKFT